MKTLLTIAMLMVSSFGLGQSIQITGTVLDPTGRAYQNGSGKADIAPNNVQWLVNNTNPLVSPVIISGLDSFGRFSISLTNTSVIAPQGSNPQWVFSFCSQTYASQPQPVCFTMTPMALTSSQDISTQIRAQSALLPSAGTGGVTSITCTAPLVCTPSPLVSTGVISARLSGNAGNLQTTNISSPTVGGDVVALDALGNTLDSNTAAATFGGVQIGNASTFGFLSLAYLSGTSGNSVEEFGDNTGDDIQFGNPAYKAGTIISNGNRTFAIVNQYTSVAGDNGATTYFYGSPLLIGVNPSPGTCTTACATPSNGFNITTGGVAVLGSFNDRYGKLRCETGLGDGLNAIAAATYLQTFCYNDSGVSWNITGIKCYTDNSGSSTLNATNGAGTGLLAGAISCSTAFASGTQSGTVTIANGDFIKFSFVADGTSKQSTWVVSLTQ